MTDDELLIRCDSLLSLIRHREKHGLTLMQLGARLRERARHA